MCGFHTKDRLSPIFEQRLHGVGCFALPQRAAGVAEPGQRSLRRRADQKDWAKRMHQFFDHFLKGTPAPEWMEKGIPYIERDEEKVKFNGKAL